MLHYSSVGASMSLLDNNKQLHGFGDTSRTLFLTINDLKLLRGGGGFEPLDDEQSKPVMPESVIWEKITGVASINDDSLMIIGSDKPPITQLSFSLQSSDDSDSFIKRWPTVKDWLGPNKPETAENDDDARLLRYLNNVYKRFDERAPTCSVGFYPESHTRGWSIECWVSKTILNALSNDFLSGRCQSIKLFVEIHPALIDNEYAGAYDHVTYGLLNPDTYGTAGYGWVNGISWGFEDKGLLPDVLNGLNQEKSVTDQDSEENLPVTQQFATETTDRLSKELKSLNLIIRTGIALILLLVLVIVFFDN